MTKPLSPAEVRSQRAVGEGFPDFVIEAVNALLCENLQSGSYASFTVTEIEKAIQAKMPKGTVWNRKWLDFEDIYAQSGWKVYWDIPGYNESYTSTVRFSVKS